VDCASETPAHPFAQRISQVTVRNGLHSLGDLLDQAIPYKQAPELFCLDLYKYFDLDILQALAQSKL